MKLIDKSGKRYRGRIAITISFIGVMFSISIFLVFMQAIFISAEEEWDDYMCEGIIDTVDLLLSSLRASDFDEETINDDTNENNIFVKGKIASAANSIYIKYIYLLKVEEDGTLSMVYSAEHQYDEHDRMGPKYEEKNIIYGYEEIINGNLVLTVDDLDTSVYWLEMECDNPHYLSTIMYSPMYNDDNELVGYVCADSNASMLSYMTKTMLMLSGVVGAMFVVFVVIIFNVVNNAIIGRPIRKLAKAANEEINSDNNRLHQFGEIKIRSKNEIGYLAASMKQMEESINKLMDTTENEAKERERISASLDIAAEIQRSQLPEEFPQSKDFDVYAIMKPAREVAGDYYDVEMLDDDHLYIMVADVSDKGVAAAMFMAISKIYFNGYAHRHITSPAKIIEEANNQLVKNNKIGMFVTAWLGILEISTGRMICANAGHEYPFIKRANGQYEILKDEHGLFVATLPNMKYKDYEIKFNKGDEIFLYTDGAPEAKNIDGELLTIEKFLEKVNEAYDKSAVTMIRNVEEKINEYRGEALQYDDITMLNLKFDKAI